MLRRSILIVSVFTLTLAFTSAAGADGVRSYLDADGSGVRVVHEAVPVVEGIGAAGPVSMNARETGIIWHNFEDQPIYTTTSLSMWTGKLAAGTWLNDPREVECIDIAGDGKPDWTHAGTKFHVSAAQNGDVIAGLDINEAVQKATVYKFTTESGTPDWSYTIDACLVQHERSIKTAADGSIIAVFVQMTGDPSFSRLYCFGPASSTPLFIYDCADYSFPRTLDITTNGEFVALYSAAKVHVVDSSTGLAREVIDAGASCTALAISGDGDYLAYGWPSFKFHAWNGERYEMYWSRAVAQFYPACCDISADGSTLVLGYNRGDCMQNRIEMMEIPSNLPVWTYLGAEASGEFQEYPEEISITDDGAYIAVASWGDETNANAELNVFEHASAEPIYELDTPGSMFDVDIAAADENTLNVTTCGKHIHANDHGRGGDIYSIEISTGGIAGDLDHDGDVDLSDLATLLANYGEVGGVTYEDGDIDGDRDVDLSDLATLLANYTGTIE